MNIARKLNQTGVFWAPGALSGSGNVTYPTSGVEVACRIDAFAALDKGARGDNKVSETIAYFLPASNIVKDGYFFEGLLTDLTAPQIADPQLVPDAFIVREIEKTPSVDASQTIVTARMERKR